jgi:hypothetical protein
VEGKYDMTEQIFPDIIKSLPGVDISIPGVEAWLAQGSDFQIVFFEIKAGRRNSPTPP